MKKVILILLLTTMAGQNNKIVAQVYKRIIGIDSIGYGSSYPPYLHQAFRFKYPNTAVGNREEVRGFFYYNFFPNNEYSDCNMYNKFNFNVLKDSMSYGRDTTHNLTRSNGALIIDNKQKVFSNNNGVTGYFDGNDTTSRFQYDNNGNLIAESYKTVPYGLKQATNQYNNLNQRVYSMVTYFGIPYKYFYFYKYGTSGNLIEETDSSDYGTSFYSINYKMKKVGSVLIKSLTISASSSSSTTNYDDSFFYNSKGLLTNVTSSNTYGLRTKYYYDTSGYLDSVVYPTNKVILYWEVYTPNSSSAKTIYRSLMNDLSVFPNPTTGQFTVLIKEKGSTLTIVNTVGQIVKEVVLKEGSNTIDCSTLAKGIYSLQFGELNESKRIIIE